MRHSARDDYPFLPTIIINGDILCTACMELASHMDNAGSGPCPQTGCEMYMQSVVQDETICKR